MLLNKSLFTYILTTSIAIAILFLMLPETNFYELALGQVSEPVTNSLKIFSESASIEEIASFVADRHGGQGKGPLTETPVIGNLTKS